MIFGAAVYNTRRSNAYEVVNSSHRRSLNGSLASGITEATSTLYLMNIFEPFAMVFNYVKTY